jgi:hypothetical protein
MLNNKIRVLEAIPTFQKYQFRKLSMDPRLRADDVQMVRQRQALLFIAAPAAGIPPPTPADRHPNCRSR